MSENTEIVGALSKDEWIARCANRYIERADLSSADALHCAAVCYDLANEDSEWCETPEDAADEDMSCWTDDGE